MVISHGIPFKKVPCILGGVLPWYTHVFWYQVFLVANDFDEYPQLPGIFMAIKPSFQGDTT